MQLLPDISGPADLFARLGLGLVLGYAGLSGLAFFYADRLIFLPPRASYSAADSGIVALRTADGATIYGLYVPNPTATYTLLHSHGNAEDVGHIRMALEQVQRAGFAVFAYDYRGYGLGAGAPSERSAYLDIEAAYRYLTDTLGVAPERIVLHGRSVGSGPALELATRVPVGGLILESAFTSAFRVVTRVPMLPFDRFRNLDKLGRVRCPVLVIHGQRDEVIPFHHGQQLFAVAPEPKQALWVKRAQHNDLQWVAGADYYAALQRFAALLDQTRGVGQYHD